MPNAQALVHEQVSIVTENGRKFNAQNTDDEQKRQAPFPSAWHLKLPDDPLWHSQNSGVGYKVQNARCNVLAFYVEGATSTLIPGIPNLLSRVAAKDFSDGSNNIIHNITPDQNLECPPHGITLAIGNEDAEPGDEDGNLDAHGNRPIEYSTQMNVLSGVSKNIK
jgi:hypothetical protein